jgi:hypothetical protein
MNLVDALSRFNRKERYWLIRNALGPSSARLDEAFRGKLGKATDTEVPEDAWWAMDYHLDWLVGALTLVAQGDRGFEAQRNADRLVTGSQQDMDLVVAFRDVLFLVEAKGETSWSNEQFGSKVERLEKLRSAGLLPASIKIFFVLMSPREPEGLKPADGTPWPTWMCNPKGGLVHIELEMPRDFLKVERWDNNPAVPPKDRDSWRIVPAHGPQQPGEL